MLKALIFIIDSNPKQISEFKHLLEDSYQIITATNKKDAIETYEKIYMKARIVLMSSRHTDEALDTLDLLKEISTIPEFIVYSDQENVKEAILFMKSGARSFIVPPFNQESLHNTIESILENFNIMDKLDEFSRKKFINQVDIDNLLQLSKEFNDHNQKESNQEKNISLQTLIQNENVKDIPLKKIQSILSQDLPDPSSFYSDRKIHILVVEDEEMYRKSLNMFLKKDYEVFLAEDGKKALSIAKENPNIDVILLDIFLPDISGTELLPQLKKLCRDAEVIIVTAFEFIDIAVKTMRDGACDYLNKPFLKVQIFEAITNALEKKYFQQILPKLGKKLLEEVLSETSKFKMLDALCYSRKEKNKNVYMEDIYTFFPDLRKTCIPEALTLPSHAIDSGIATFIKELRKRVKQFNPLSE